jgi:hypothetical protein
MGLAERRRIVRGNIDTVKREIDQFRLALGRNDLSQQQRHAMERNLADAYVILKRVERELNSLY